MELSRYRTDLTQNNRIEQTPGPYAKSHASLTSGPVVICARVIASVCVLRKGVANGGDGGGDGVIIVILVLVKVVRIRIRISHEVTFAASPFDFFGSKLIVLPPLSNGLTLLGH